MMRSSSAILSIALAFVSSGMAQDQNTNTTTRQWTTATLPAAGSQGQKTNNQNGSVQTPARKAGNKQSVPGADDPTISGVIAAFDALIGGIQRADVNAATGAYLNSPKLLLFNYNGSVTRGWEQMRKNRESSYPELKNVKIDIRDRNVEMLGTTAALVTCLWTQSDVFRGTPETASGRMTLVFRRTGGTWKAVHLHTSPDAPNPSRVPTSEQTVSPAPSPTPKPKTTP